MSKLLVTWCGNYADEFDMSGWLVMEQTDYDDMINDLIMYEGEISWYFGSNEEMQYESGADLASDFEAEKITDEQAKVLEDLFGGGFGETRAFSARECFDEDEED